MKATKYRTIRPELVGLILAVLICLLAQAARAQMLIGPAVQTTRGYTGLSYLNHTRDSIITMIHPAVRAEAYMATLARRYDDAARWDAIRIEQAPRLFSRVAMPVHPEAMKPGEYSQVLQFRQNPIRIVTTFQVLAR